MVFWKLSTGTQQSSHPLLSSVGSHGGIHHCWEGRLERGWLVPENTLYLIRVYLWWSGTRRCIGVFYADDGIIRSQDPEWLHGVLNLIIACSTGLYWWPTSPSTKYDVPYRDYLLGNVRGRGGMENYMDRSDLTGESKAMDTVPALRSGTDGGFNNSPLQAPA